MRGPSIGSLRRLMAASGDLAGRFLADETTRTGLDALDGHASLCVTPETLRGRVVLLACARQFATAQALIDLDGVARRIVLCPPDLPASHLRLAMDEADVDAIATDQGVLEDGGRPVIQVGPPGVRARASESAPDPASKTEWIMFTSGTTGRPKMVVHSLTSLAGHLPAGPPSGRPLTWCTFYDIRRYGGLQILLRALVGGGSLVLSSAGETPGAFLARAGAHGATHFLGTPSHWRRALMTQDCGRIAADYVRLSGEVADQAILDRLAALYPSARLVHAFASTETGVAFEVEDRLAGFPAALFEGAPPGSGAELRVRDGSLQVRSTRLAAGRLGGSASALADAEGFVDTGDIVERRGDRYHFAGRREGIVNVGGNKVHPEEVEAVINRHPSVRMSLVRARANPITGAVVVADVVARTEEGAAAAADLAGEVIALCRRELDAHKVPATVRIVASLEIGPAGKLARAGA